MPLTDVPEKAGSPVDKLSQPSQSSTPPLPSFVFPWQLLKNSPQHQICVYEWWERAGGTKRETSTHKQPVTSGKVNPAGRWRPDDRGELIV